MTMAPFAARGRPSVSLSARILSRSSMRGRGVAPGFAVVGVGGGPFSSAGSTLVTGGFFRAAKAAGASTSAAASRTVRLGEDLAIDHRPGNRRAVLDDL